jgi:hypothetical protein
MLSFSLFRFIIHILIKNNEKMLREFSCFTDNEKKSGEAIEDTHTIIQVLNYRRIPNHFLNTLKLVL